MVCGYNIIGLLGQGGFSQIYKAHSPDGTQVILKFPDVSMLGDQATYERFRREVAIGQKLDHPAIPRTISFIEGPDSVFLVMEYIEGPSLREYITEKAPLPFQKDFYSLTSLPRPSTTCILTASVTGILNQRISLSDRITRFISSILGVHCLKVPAG